MKTRILVYKDGNGNYKYRPQYRWCGFWLYFKVCDIAGQSIVEKSSLSGAMGHINHVHRNSLNKKRIFCKVIKQD